MPSYSPYCVNGGQRGTVSSFCSRFSLKNFIPPILHTYISFIKHRRYVILASDSVVRWNISLSLCLSNCNANRTMHIRVLTFFNSFATSHTKRERKNPPVGTVLYNSNRWIIRRLGSSFTTPDKRNYNIYENNQQDALNCLIYYSNSALHVSGDVFAHHQEHLTVFAVSGSVHPSCCRLVSRMSWNWTM